jgi:hypothetical protein
MRFRLLINCAAGALLAILAGGCATSNHLAPLVVQRAAADPKACSTAEQTLDTLFPATYEAAERAIVTLGGKQFTCDGLLQASPASGLHLAVVSEFGVATALRVKANGECEILKVTPLFREDWSRQFVARDLRRLFARPAALQPAGRLADGRLVLQSGPDAGGVTAQYVFSADGAAWTELDLTQNGKTFYQATVKPPRHFAGLSAAVPGGYEVRAEAYRLDLAITELTVSPRKEAP